MKYVIVLSIVAVSLHVVGRLPIDYLNSQDARVPLAAASRRWPLFYPDASLAVLYAQRARHTSILHRVRRLPDKTRKLLGSVPAEDDQVQSLANNLRTGSNAAANGAVADELTRILLDDATITQTQLQSCNSWLIATHRASWETLEPAARQLPRGWCFMLLPDDNISESTESSQRRAQTEHELARVVVVSTTTQVKLSLRLAKAFYLAPPTATARRNLGYIVAIALGASTISDIENAETTALGLSPHFMHFIASAQNSSELSAYCGLVAHGEVATSVARNSATGQQVAASCRIHRHAKCIAAVTPSSLASVPIWHAVNSVALPPGCEQRQLMSAEADFANTAPTSSSVVMPSAMWSLVLPVSHDEWHAKTIRQFAVHKLMWDAGIPVGLAAVQMPMADSTNPTSDMLAWADSVESFMLIWSSAAPTMYERVLQLYVDMYEHGFVELDDVMLAYGWVEALTSVRYAWPAISPVEGSADSNGDWQCVNDNLGGSAFGGCDATRALAAMHQFVVTPASVNQSHAQWPRCAELAVEGANTERSPFARSSSHVCTVPVVAVAVLRESPVEPSILAVADILHEHSLGIVLVVTTSPSIAVSHPGVRIVPQHSIEATELTRRCTTGASGGRGEAECVRAQLRNVGYSFAARLHPCSVMDVQFHTWLDVVLALDTISAAAKPVRVAGLTPYHAGVRQRDPAGCIFVNPYAALAPSPLVVPRGFPASANAGQQAGSGCTVPEFVRLAAGGRDTVGVWQSAHDLHDRRIAFSAKHAGVILAPDVFAAYGVDATVHMAAALWSTFLPTPAPATLECGAGVLRSYVSEAVFQLVGLQVGFTKPWARHVGRAVSQTTDMQQGGPDNDLPHVLLVDASSCPAEIIVAEVTSWQASARRLCGSIASSSADRTDGLATGNCSAPALLYAAYAHLARMDLVSGDTPAMYATWLQGLARSLTVLPSAIDAMQHAGQPTHDARCASLVVTPPRPPPLPVHVVVHANTGMFSSIPLWHSLFAAQFSKVTYFVEETKPSAAAAPNRSTYPTLTTVTPPRHPGVSGFAAYETFVMAYSDALEASDTGELNFTDADGRPIEATVWQHDDAFIDLMWLDRWLHAENQTATCLAIAPSIPLPRYSRDAWAGVDWHWARIDETFVAIEQLLQFSASDPRLACGGDGRRLQEDDFRDGLADAFVVRWGDGPANRTASCEGSTTFAQWLQAAMNTGLFLEIAVPTAARCAFDAAATTEYRLATWRTGGPGAERGDPAFAWTAWLQHGPAVGTDVLHPMKLSGAGAIEVLLAARDGAWAEIARNARSAE